MAIQQINLGSAPSGAGGDTQRAANTKINQNFSNTAHAANRLVGTENSQIPLAQQTFEAAFSRVTNRAGTNHNADDFKAGTACLITPGTINSPKGINAGAVCYTQAAHSDSAATSVQIVYSYMNGSLFTRGVLAGNPGAWNRYYHTGNTTVDSNKNIKTSSPVVRVFADHLDKIHEANDLPIKYTRNGVGDYTIEGTTGLRENDWQIVIPKDDHDNQLIAFTIEDNDGTIRLKTYKRIFNMTSFMFEPDLNTPLDIPEGRWVDLHFNDIPQEQLDESIE